MAADRESDDVLAAIARRLAYAIGEGKWTGAGLARRSGVDPTTISKLQNKLRGTTITSYIKLSGALGVPPEWLMLGTGPTPAIRRAPDDARDKRRKSAS